VETNVRFLETIDDFRACVALQRATWGAAFRDCVPPAVLQITRKMGGVVAGAFDRDGTMLGFVYGITGWKEGELCHWSHMLAVKDTHRDRGIGGDLKAFQRTALTSHGVSTMYWTYDPLVARNAYLNLRKLGARVVEYVPDMYGSDESSTTDSVIGSDRLVVRWELETGRALGGAIEGDPESILRVEIPHDIQRLKTEAPDEAREWRAATRKAFQSHLNSGRRVVGFHRGSGNEPSYYTLTSDPTETD
jgi:predicted GNAT superfamily acetyltransferase